MGETGSMATHPELGAGWEENKRLLAVSPKTNR
jgi:hypothetical protein